MPGQSVPSRAISAMPAPPRPAGTMSAATAERIVGLNKRRNVRDASLIAT